MTKVLLLMRAAVVAMLFAFGAVATAPVMAQDPTEPVQEVDETTDDAVDQAQETTDDVVTQAEDAVTDDEGGFQWGLLGLLGLAGLAGLMRRPEPAGPSVDSTANRPVTRVDDRDDRGGTTI